MKTAVVISDTHGNKSAFEKLKTVLDESDYIIHLGDTSGDGSALKKLYPNKTYLLNGNCDLYDFGDDELVLQIEDVKIFACHGDRYGVKRGYERLAERAAELGCHVALFGHTHCAAEETIGAVTLFNPGTLSRYAHKSYLYLVINGGKAVGKTVFVD